jgi:methionyl-tRNA formyltransferase
MKSNAECRFLVSGYGLPAEYGVNTIFSLGVKPESVAILTHEQDFRNSGLHSLAKLRGLALSTSSPKSDEAFRFVKEFNPDIILSLHYRNIIPKQLLDLAAIGNANLHPSLLPEYKGTNSVAWVIINGEEKTGFTFHVMDASIDTGNILIQEEIEIYPSDTAFSLFHRQIVQAMKRVQDVIDMLVAGCTGVSQSDGGSYYSRELPFSGIINPDWSIDKIERFIRAMYFPPFDPAVLVYGNASYHVETLEQYMQLAHKLNLNTERT